MYQVRSSKARKLRVEINWKIAGTCVQKENIYYTSKEKGKNREKCIKIILHKYTVLTVGPNLH